MIGFALLLVCIVGGVYSLLWFVRLPDPDRPRAYPRTPSLWHGLGGEPGSLSDALRSGFFYLLVLTAFGAFGAVLGTSMPFHLATSLAAALLGALIVATLASRRLLRAGKGAMQALPSSSKVPPGPRPRVLFICGSLNQTTQMHAIARAMPDVEAWFTPYYTDGWLIRWLVKLGLLESTILGFRRRGACLDYLNERGLPVDLGAERNAYDLALTCNDQIIPSVLARTPWVLVQEGIQEPPSWRTWLWKRMRILPAPLAGTANFGLSNRYTHFCVASAGYRDNYVAEGIPDEKLVVTGIPNFDDFARLRDNAFPHAGYVLVCTSDARETLLASDREALLQRAVALRAGRPLFFKLHPNENVERATREILRVAPDARVFTQGSAEEMVAKCDVLVTEWSSVTFCGVALGKEVHSWHSLDEIKRLLPEQNGRAAENIADVCRARLKEKGR